MTGHTCPVCDDEGEVFVGYHHYDEDGTPIGPAVFEPCEACGPRPPSQRQGDPKKETP